MWAELTYRLIGAGLLCVLGLWPGQMIAAENLNLDTAIERALGGNPELALSAYERQIQEGQVRQSAIRPKVELDLEVENFLGTGFYEGVDGTEATLSLVWILERGKRQHRVAAAQAGLAQVSVQTHLQRIDVAAHTAQAFLDVLKDQERLVLADAGVRLGESGLAAVTERVSAGRSPTIDLDRAEADLAWLRLDREDVEHELLVSRKTLAATWGSSVLDFAAVSGDIKKLPEPGTYAALVAQAASFPMINQFMTRQRVRDAELRLAEAEARQDWRLRAGGRYLNLTDDAAFVAGISMPLGRGSQNQGRIDSARARAAMTDGERVATRLSIETTLFRLHQELVHNIHRAQSMREEVLPRLESVVSGSEAAYSAGRFSYLELRQSQSALLEVRQAYLEENYQAQANRIAIERLTGSAVADDRTDSGESS